MTAPTRDLIGRASAGLLAALLLTGVASHAPAATPLKVGMDTRSRPWAFVPGLDYSKENWAEAPKITSAQIAQLQGVDIEVLKALARRLDVVPEIVPSAWAGIENGLLAKRFDIIINAWVPNSKTSPGILASSPYYDWGLIVAVRARDMRIKSYRDLGGMKVGYFRDVVVDRSVRTLGAAQLIPLDDSDQLFDELGGGSVDAAVEDSTYVRWRVAHDSAFRVVGDSLNRLGYHVALRKTDTELYRRVQAAIRDFVVSGEATKIRERWEGPTTPGLISH